MIFNFKLNVSIKYINNIIPNIAFKVFDLSPVIKTEKKNKDIAVINTNFPNFLFFRISSRYPDIKNKKPFT